MKTNTAEHLPTALFQTHPARLCTDCAQYVCDCECCPVTVRALPEGYAVFAAATAVAQEVCS